MEISQCIAIAAPVSQVWDLLMDVPRVSHCVPGTDSIRQVDPNTYEGIMRARVGPIAVKLTGRIILVEQDRESWRARMTAEGTDRIVGGAVSAKMSMSLRPLEDGRTEMDIHTDASILGKIGQFGQGVIRKKADDILSQFATNLTRSLTAQ